MKSGLVAMIHAAAAARDEGLLTSARIGIVLVPDEETAGPRGSRDLAMRGILGKDGIGMLTPEPTGGIVLQRRLRSEDPLGRILSSQILSVTGREAAFEMCPGLLETRWYAARGIPAFAYGPGLLSVSHGPNEFVPIRNIVQCALVYALTAAEMLLQ